MSNHKNFEGMMECTFCGSGTFDGEVINYEKTGTVTYCRRCWKEFGNGVEKPVDNTPEARS